MGAAGEHGGHARWRPAAERRMCMMLYAPGRTGKAGEPARGMAWLRGQAYMASRYAPGPGGGLGLAELGRALDAARVRLSEAGLVEGGGDGGEVRLTQRGMGEAVALWDGAGGDAREAAAVAKEFLNDMGYWEMTSFMRSEYPEEAWDPGTAERFEKERLGAAASLTMRLRVSAAKGAAIAGMGTGDFVAELRRRGYEPYTSGAEDLEESIRAIGDIPGH